MNVDLTPLAELIAASLESRLRDFIPDDQVLNARQAGELLGLHPNTIAKLASGGRIPGHRYGDQWRFSKRALLAQLSDTAESSVQQLRNAAD